METKEENDINYLRRFIWISLGIVSLTALIAVGEGLVFGWAKSAHELGDSFGLANALFSGLAFAGVIVALLMQRDDLGQQKKELRLTREVFKRQQFESSFFQMLTLHHEIVKAMEYTNEEHVDEQSNDLKSVLYRRRECFRPIYRNLCGWYELKSDDKNVEAPVKEAYDSTYRGAETLLGHYFRNLYTLVSFVDENEIDNPRDYTNMIRAQLSSCELLLLFYNCEVGIGRKKFKSLVEDYALIKNMPTNQLLNREHKDLFSPSAYQGRS